MAATWIRSSSDCTATAPCRSSTAWKTCASVISEPVCAAEARAAASVAPVFSTTAGLPAARSAASPATKSAASRIPSMNIATTRVASSAARNRSASPIRTSASLPVAITDESPTCASCARSVMRPPTPPDCVTTPIPPAVKWSRYETLEAITQAERVMLIRPDAVRPDHPQAGAARELGDLALLGAARLAGLASSRTRRRCSPRRRRAAHSSSDAITRAFETAITARSIGPASATSGTQRKPPTSS